MGGVQPWAYEHLVATYLPMTDECVVWDSAPAALANDGREPRIGMPDGRVTTVMAVACELAYGPRPEDHVAMRLCSTNGCYNADHLRWATRHEVTEHSREVGTLAIGDRHPLTKHPEHERRDALRALANGSTPSEVSRRFGINRSLLYRWRAREEGTT